MTPIYPAPGSNKTRRKAFTFLEVLVALAIAGILAMAACSSIIVALRAEQLARHMGDARMILCELASDRWIGHQPTGLSARVEQEWSMEFRRVTVEHDDTNLTWRLWTLSPMARPSWTLTFAFDDLPSTNAPSSVE